ncbi:MAG: hypothetical protein AB7G47_11955 [Mycolicibacterium sp.]
MAVRCGNSRPRLICRGIVSHGGEEAGRFSSRDARVLAFVGDRDGSDD